MWAEGRDVPLSRFDAMDDAGIDEWTLLSMATENCAFLRQLKIAFRLGEGPPRV